MGLRSIPLLGSHSRLRAGAWFCAIIALLLHWSVPVLATPQFNAVPGGIPLELSTDDWDGHFGIAARNGGRGLSSHYLGALNRSQEVCQFGGAGVAIRAAVATIAPSPLPASRPARGERSADTIASRLFNARAPPSV